MHSWVVQVREGRKASKSVGRYMIEYGYMGFKSTTGDIENKRDWRQRFEKSLIFSWCFIFIYSIFVSVISDPSLIVQKTKLFGSQYLD